MGTGLLFLQILQQLEAACGDLAHASLYLLGQNLIRAGQEGRKGQGGDLLVVLAPEVAPASVLPCPKNHLQAQLLAGRGLSTCQIQGL